jgi:hypothetical protein
LGRREILTWEEERQTLGKKGDIPGKDRHLGRRKIETWEERGQTLGKKGDRNLGRRGTDTSEEGRQTWEEGDRHLGRREIETWEQGDRHLGRRETETWEERGLRDRKKRDRDLGRRPDRNQLRGDLVLTECYYITYQIII